MLITIGRKPEDSGKFTTPGKSEFTTEYLGRSNNKFDVPASILRSRLCPKPGTRDADSGDPRAYIRDVDVRRDPKNWFYWHITTISTTEWEPDQDDNPLDKVARIVLKSDQYTEPTYKDVKGEFIRNTVGTIVPLPKEQSRWIIEVEKNVRSIPAAILNLNNKVNAGAMFIRGMYIPKQTLMVKGIIGEEVTTSVGKIKLTYYALKFQLHYRREGWRVKFPNVDLMQRKRTYGYVTKAGKVVSIGEVQDDELQRDSDGNAILRVMSNVRVPIPDEKGEARTEPWPVNKNGVALPLDFKPEEVLMNEAEIYESADISILPLV